MRHYLPYMTLRLHFIGPPCHAWTLNLYRNLKATYLCETNIKYADLLAQVSNIGPSFSSCSEQYGKLSSYFSTVEIAQLRTNYLVIDQTLLISVIILCVNCLFIVLLFPWKCWNMWLRHSIYKTNVFLKIDPLIIACWIRQSCPQCISSWAFWINNTFTKK